MQSVYFDKNKKVVYDPNTKEIVMGSSLLLPTPSITPSISITQSIPITPSISVLPISVIPTPSITPSPIIAIVSGFTTEWTVSGDDTERTISMPFTDYGTYNATIYWGDGTYSGVTSWDDANNIHTYDANGTYIVEIMGSAPGWSFLSNTTHREKITDIIHWGDRSKFDGFENLNGGFAHSGIVSTGSGKILSNGENNVETIFIECYSLTTLTPGFMDELTGITSLSQGFFLAPLTSIPNDLLKNIVLLDTAQYLFAYTEITTIPDDLFKYNLNLSNFSNTFQGCSLLTGITDGDLFNWTTNTCYFDQTFLYCIALETIPNGLLRNPKLRTCVQTFKGCAKLEINPWTFYTSSGDTATRFYDKNLAFDSCFYRDSFTGNQGIAPDLWNCDFGTGEVSYGGCFGGTGNDGTSINNYGDIPAGWL